MICVLHRLGSDPGRRDRPIRTGRRDKPIIQLPSVALRVAVMVGIAAGRCSPSSSSASGSCRSSSGQQFVAQANDNRLTSVKIVAPRGPIVDRNGEVIVENRPGLAVGIRLMDVPDGAARRRRSRRLARVLQDATGGDPRRRSWITCGPSWPIGEDAPPLDVGERRRAARACSLDLVVIKDDVGKRRVVSYILEHTQSFPGVEIQTQLPAPLPARRHGGAACSATSARSRPSSSRSSTSKGYSAGDVVGQDGLEWTYDRWLRGRDGVAKVEVDAFGRPKQRDAVPGGRLPEPGDTLVTTIDAKVQATAEEALRYGIDLAHSDGKVRRPTAAPRWCWT